MGTWLVAALGVSDLRRDLEEAAKSTAGHQRISQGDLLRFRIPVAPLEEQVEILRAVEAAVSACHGLESIHAGMNADFGVLDQSILRQAFEGRLLAADATRSTFGVNIAGTPTRPDGLDVRPGRRETA